MQRKSEQFIKTEVNVGIDVSKAMLDVFFMPIGKTLQVSNNQKGFKELIKAMKEYDVSAIGIEATGKYHIGLHQTLHERGYHVVILNPYSQTALF